MVTMKLYTEEQVRKAIEFARDTHQEGRPYLERDVYDYSYDEIINMLTPIELPSDEEIEEAAIKIVNEHCDSQSGDLTVEVECFEAGVYWIKKQILNQNK